MSINLGSKTNQMRMNKLMVISVLPLKKTIHMKNLLYILLLCSIVSSSSCAQNVEYAKSIKIGKGSKPAIAYDKDSKTLHLVYRHGDSLLYRSGDLKGVFSKPELILVKPKVDSTMKWATENLPKSWIPEVVLHFWSPTIKLDNNGAPHVAFCDGHYLNYNTWYTNKTNDTWKKPAVVFNRVQDEVSRTTMPHLQLGKNNDIYLSTFAPAGIKKKVDYRVKGIIARIEFEADNFKIGWKRRVSLANPQLGFIGDRLFAAGPDGGCYLQELDPKGLFPIGPRIELVDARAGEYARMFENNNGDDLLVVSTHTRLLEHHPKGGWFNTYKRALAGKKPIYYKTTNRHAWGGAVTFQDLKSPELTYIAHWSGVEGDHLGEVQFPIFRKSTGNRIHISVIKNDELVLEHQPINEEIDLHGFPRRVTPAVVPNPDGGGIAVIEAFDKSAKNDWEELGTLYLSTFKVK